MTTTLSLEALLEQTNQAAEALQQVLHTEKEALAQADGAALLELYEQKKQALDTMETLRHHQEQIGDLKTAIAQAPIPQRAKLEQLQQQLHSTMEKCQRQNDINELVGRISSQNNQRILALLQGQDPTVATYGAKGETSAQRHSNYDIEA